MKNLLLPILTFVLCSGALTAQEKIPYGNNPAVGRHVELNGVDIYYEIYGEGQPLLLIHGNGGSIAGRAKQIPVYAQKYKVIALDSRCHGHSGCPAGDLTYEQMAADVNALLDHLHIDSCYIWGHSDGGIIALIMGFQYPQKVKRMVVSGANLTPDTTAVFPALVEMVGDMYAMISDTVMKKQIKLLADQPHIPFEALHRIQAPVLVMAGDRDAIREEHTVRIYQSIPNAQLCILPGTTHFVSSDRPALFNSLLLDFFEKPFAMPSTVEMIKQMAERMKQQKH